MVGEVLPAKVQVPHQLLDVNTTTVNQLLGLPGMFSTFVAKDLRGLRILALTASSASIVACTASIFFLVNIDRRKRVFRHDLVFFLIICDLVKALVLMIYPLVILVRNDVYADPRFFNTLGWFTAYCVEGADLAIFFFAIHFALLIFLPSWKWRRSGSRKMEGGLYGVRKYIWPITALVPVLLASLAFINFQLLDFEELVNGTTVILDNDNYHFRYDARLGGYKPYSAWCYLPPYPVWYKLVLSWGPRYFIIIFILVLYISIYVFVKKESKRIKRHLYDFRDQRAEEHIAELRAKSRWELLKIRLFRFLVKPFVQFLLNLKNFLSFSFDESSVPTSGRNNMTSGGSFYATDEGASFDQVPNIRVSRALDRAGTLPGEDSYTNNESSQASKSGNIQSGTLKENDDLDSHNNLHGHTPPIPGKLMPPNGNSHRFSRCISPIQTPSVHDNRAAENEHEGEVPQANKSDPRRASTTDVKHVQATFQKQTYATMKRRRAQIQKNLRSIFIYPFSYIGIWIFPLIVDITQYRHEIIHGPIVWLIYIATLAQPLNGLVDTLVFVYREKPWRYSWSEVQFRELLEAYSLRDKMGEQDIKELYHSELGKKGWYYCGRFDRLCCWKHKPQWWKRAGWYVYRSLCGLIQNKYDFEDTCEDLPLDCNYDSKDSWTCFNLNKLRCEQHERQFSFPSDSTTGSGPVQSRRGSDSNIDYVRVPTFWRFIHLLPMLKGIDLDELDRQLRQKAIDHDFVLPGLHFALNKDTDGRHDLNRTYSKPIFKPEYSINNEKKAADKTQNGESARAHPASAHVHLDVNADFGDTVKKEPAKYFEEGDTQSHGNESDKDRIGMLAFLNGPTN